MMQTETFGRARLLRLDLLRGVAALMVASAHFAPYGTFGAGPRAGLCVAFFFLLSGYVLSHAYGDAIRAGRMSLGRFAVLRLARLYPLHILTMAAVAALWGVMALARRYGAPVSVEFACGAREAIEHLALLHFLLGGANCFNAPSWSIAVEFWAGFSILLLFQPGRGFVKAAFLIAAMAALAVVEMHGGFSKADREWIGPLEKNYVTGVALFAAGWALHALARVVDFSRVPAALSWSVGMATFASLVIGPDAPEAVYFLAFGATVLLLGHPRPSPCAGIMALAGDLSYGIYLWHIPVALALIGAARAVEIVTGRTIVGSAAMNAIFLAALLAVAWIGHRCWEMPAKRWLRGDARRELAYTTA